MRIEAAHHLFFLFVVFDLGQLQHEFLFPDHKLQGSDRLRRSFRSNHALLESTRANNPSSRRRHTKRMQGVAGAHPLCGLLVIPQVRILLLQLFDPPPHLCKQHDTLYSEAGSDGSEECCTRPQRNSWR